MATTGKEEPSFSVSEQLNNVMQYTFENIAARFLGGPFAARACTKETQTLYPSVLFRNSFDTVGTERANSCGNRMYQVTGNRVDGVCGRISYALLHWGNNFPTLLTYAVLSVTSGGCR